MTATEEQKNERPSDCLHKARKIGSSKRDRSISKRVTKGEEFEGVCFTYTLVQILQKDRLTVKVGMGGGTDALVALISRASRFSSGRGGVVSLTETTRSYVAQMA